MTTLSDFKEKLLRILADPDGQQFDTDLLADGVAAALDAILPWLWKRSVDTLNGDGTTVTFALPADLYKVVSVFDEYQGLYVPRNILQAGRRPGGDETNQDWIEYPAGFLTFANAPEEDVVVYYGAVWTKPTDDADVLEIPDYGLQALLYYAASHVLMKNATSTANQRQYNIKVDSGTPVMNPLLDVVRYYLERFNIEVGRLPIMERGVHG